MKRMTASEVRRNWFRVLDRVVAGEVVVVERTGQTVVLRREDARTARASAVPDYRQLIRVPGAEEADRWRWEWGGDVGVRLRDALD